jgi:hypothetical protein
MNIAELQMQRDRALACLILAVCISLACFLSVFGKGERLAMESAKSAVVAHEILLRETARTLDQNQEALIAVRAALDNTNRSRRP